MTAAPIRDAGTSLGSPGRALTARSVAKPGRLSGATRFDRVVRRGRRVRRGGIVLAYRRRDGGLPRIGLVVGRRVGGAVVRNRAKRRLRAALRHAELPEATDYVVIAAPAVVTAPFEDLCGWVTEAVAAMVPAAGSR